ncbi:MAG: response regulator transcription factor [Anaerolineae bacterium]|nr:response regulator transcription factor [Thermoflexales bacterium]MDW8408683.1 response regulator transcription factor [Anaerolineae bacterium]
MPIRVFLADDHAIVRDGLRVLLEAQGDIQVVGAASDGRQTVELAKQLLPDLVIMDIAMPGLNGIDAAEHIRRACPSVRVLMLSMYSTAEHIVRALNAGAQGFLLKESAGAEVVQAVRSIVAGRPYFSEKILDAGILPLADRRLGAPFKSPLDRLSARERQVLQLVAEGKTSAQIAGMLHLSPKSVETYRSRLMHKIGVNDLPALVKFAVQHGLTTLN